MTTFAKLEFYGAAQNVTGSVPPRSLRKENPHRLRTLPEREPGRNGTFQVNPEIDAVVLTHAHLDHCGLLPRLVNRIQRSSTPQGNSGHRADRPARQRQINEEGAGKRKDTRRRDESGRTQSFRSTPLTGDGGQATPESRIPSTLQLARANRQIRQRRSHIKSGIPWSPSQSEMKPEPSSSRETWGVMTCPFSKTQAHRTSRLCRLRIDIRRQGHRRKKTSRLNSLRSSTRHQGEKQHHHPSFAIERTQELIYFLAQLLKEDEIPT